MGVRVKSQVNTCVFLTASKVVTHVVISELSKNSQNCSKGEKDRESLLTFLQFDRFFDEI